MKLPTIDPTTGLAIAGCVAVLDAIAKGTLALPDYIPVSVVHVISRRTPSSSGCSCWPCADDQRAVLQQTRAVYQRSARLQGVRRWSA